MGTLGERTRGKTGRAMGEVVGAPRAPRAPPPPPPRPPMSAGLIRVVTGVAGGGASARGGERASARASARAIPPPAPPKATPPKTVKAKVASTELIPPPKPPPPKPPKPPPPKPPRPPEGPPPVASKKRPIPKPDSSSDEDDDTFHSCDEELEEGEVPRLVNLLGEDATSEDDEQTVPEIQEPKRTKRGKQEIDKAVVVEDDPKTPSSMFAKVQPRTPSHELMGGGEFESIENIARIRDNTKDMLNNVNSPEIKKTKKPEKGKVQRANAKKAREKAQGDHSVDEEMARLIKERRLALVLDLDHTLLNSVLVPDLRANPNSLVNAMRLLDHDVGRAERANDPLKRACFHLPHFDLFTKLRPGVRRFIERASQLFEIHVDTMGSQVYAEQMVMLIDPEKKWIKGSVRGLGEMENGKLTAPAYKSLDDCGLGNIADICLVFDDTASVWEQHLKNLVTCERYLFFPQARRQFGLPGVSLLDIGQDENEAEGMLSTAMRVFESVHAEFFDRYDASKGTKVPRVQDVLSERRKTVLAGLHIVFSRVFPKSVASESQPLWIYAEDFGAQCSNEITSETTHVVGTALATAKVQEAKKRRNIHIVSPHWLECSMLLWRRANERTFTITE